MFKALFYRHRTSLLVLGFALLVCALPESAYAESPWERAVRVLAESFTGPIAKGLTLVAVVIGGLMIAYDESGNKRIVAGLIFGCGMALGAASFIAWLLGF